jgi:hypothetical protein
MKPTFHWHTAKDLNMQSLYLKPQRSRQMLSWIGLAVLSLLNLNGCLNTPSSEQVNAVIAGGIPDHAAFGSTSCETCHSLDRPAPTIAAETGAEVIHGGGRDCGECHIAGAANWRTFVPFSHSPLPATCDTCHLASRPTAIVNDKMAHTYAGVGDCVACHAPGAGVTWANGTYVHEPLPGSCAECHSAQRPTTVVNSFSHDAGGTGDCVNCHKSVGVTWSGGFFAHSPTPANCSGCHSGIRPTGPVGTPPFDHAIAGTGDCKSCHAVQSDTKNDWTGGSFSHIPAPTTCIDCHVGIRPVGPAGTPAFDHAKGGTGDCVSCHLPKSVTQTDWSGAAFSHSPAPSACKDCHVGDRPAGPVGTPAFDHAIAGMGDCKSCHVVQSPTKNDWTGGSFTHVPAPTTCIGCHLPQRPVTLTSSGFDHAKNGTGDCADCHRDPGVRWTGATGYDHSTIPAGTRCDSCHAPQRPTSAISVAWPGNPTKPNQFLHSVTASTDCKVCHLDAGVAWAPGLYAHNPNPGQCTVCHLNQRPVGPAGSPVFDHALGGTGDCVACHAVGSATKTDWTGGNFTHTNAITACAGCHASTRPTGLVGNPPFNHAIAGTGDCKSCHAIKSATKTDWTGGTFTHVPKPTTCASCHISVKPAAAVRGTAVSTDGRTYQNDYLHSLIAGDCVSCHLVKSATQTDWTRGNYSHSPAPASCATCHAITKPTVVVSGFDHSQAGLSDCKSCHAFPGQKWTGASAIPSSVILTPPTGKAWPNITAPHPVIDAAKTGITCSTCHGANTSAKIIDYDHAFPVAGSKCVYCHYTGQTETSAAVTTKSHESTSNTKDCNVSGCHRPKSYPTWKATQFSGGEWGSP